MTEYIKNTEGLMIGNLLKSKSKNIILPIERLSISSITLSDGKHLEISYADNHFIYDVEPVFLTEEWLLKFGFEVDSSNFRTIKMVGNSEHWLSYDDQTGMYLEYEENEKESLDLSHIRYIHQLQNLYFNLTGEDLIKN